MLKFSGLKFLGRHGDIGPKTVADGGVLHKPVSHVKENDPSSATGDVLRDDKDELRWKEKESPHLICAYRKVSEDSD